LLVTLAVAACTALLKISNLAATFHAVLPATGCYAAFIIVMEVVVIKGKFALPTKFSYTLKTNCLFNF